MELKTKICLKRDTLINWIEANPLLPEGEAVNVWSSQQEVQLKVGDRERAFLDLSYISFLTKVKGGNN